MSNAHPVPPESVAAIDEYIKNLRSKGRLARSTLNAYLSDLLALNERLERTGVHLLNATEQDIEKDRDARLRKSRPASVARALTSARGFFNSLVRQGIITKSPLKFVRQPEVRRYHVSPRLLTQGELEDILNASDLSESIGKRNNLLLRLIATTDIRSSVVVALTLSDIGLNTGNGPTLKRMDGDSTVVIEWSLLRDIREYVKTERSEILIDKEPGYLFPSGPRDCLSRQMLWRVLQDCAKKAGIRRRVTAHTLRRSYLAHYSQQMNLR